ncbi:MAG: coiled-coil protein [Thermoproteota archaeon]
MSNNEHQGLEELQQSLSALNERKANLVTEARKWSKKRDKLNNVVKNLGEEIKQLKKRRDQLNQKVQEFKDHREKSKERISVKIQEIQDLNQKIKTLTPKKPSKPLATLQKEIQEKEWQIQTTSTSLEEERILVNQVRELTSQVELHKRLRRLYQKRRELQTGLDAAKIQNNLSHKKLLKTAQRSQGIHQKMVNKIEEVKCLAKKADRMHQRFVEIQQGLNSVQEEKAEVSGQIVKLKKEIQKKERKEKEKKERALREKIGEEAREKMNQGGRLTFGEFKILIDEEGKQD